MDNKLIIGNAFSLNMINFPANISCNRIPVRRIREMISDSPAKMTARKLIKERNVKVFDEDDRIEIAYNLENGEREYGHWEFMFRNNPRYDEQAKILKDLGLSPEQDEVVDLIAEKGTEVVSLESAIGHVDTARIVTEILRPYCPHGAEGGRCDPEKCILFSPDKCPEAAAKFELPVNRMNVKLYRGEKMIVAQYSGPRLPEGATILPEGAKIDFVLVGVD